MLHAHVYNQPPLLHYKAKIVQQISGEETDTASAKTNGNFCYTNSQFE